MPVQDLFSIIQMADPQSPQLQHLRAQTEELQVRTQGEKLALQNQAAFQQAMGRIFPSGFDPGVYDAAAQGDNASRMKLQALQQAYAMYDPSKLPSLMNATEMAAKRQADVRAEEQKRMGSLFSAINNADDYNAALPDIQAAGGLQRFGLTGNYATDKSRIGVLGRSGMTAAQQAVDEYRYIREGDRLNQQDIDNRRKQENQDFREQVHRDHEKQVADLQRRFAEREQRARDMEDDKNARSLAHVRNSVAKVTQDNLKSAQLFVKTDERTRDLPANMQQQMARDVAQIAKNAMAKSITEVGKLPDEDEYSSLMDDALKRLMKEGKITREYSTFLGMKVPGTTEGKYRMGRGEQQATFEPTKKAGGGGYSADQSALIDRWVRTNPGKSREDIIEHLKEMGKL